MSSLLRLTAVAALTLLVACAESTAPPDTAPPDQQSPGQIPGRYIVVLKPNAPGTAQLMSAVQEAPGLAGATVDYTYSRTITGFAGAFTDAAIAQLRTDPRVDFIEPDQVMYAIVTQNNATWGLDRTDQRALPLSTTYTYTSTGSGVRAYIIDTGILLAHTDFGGRAVTGFDAVTSGGSANDCHGHGTHVAGTVGGNTWGIAKNVSLIAVRVLNCSGSGTTSGVIAGVDWVASNAVLPAVANMSLGGGASSALDQAINRGIDAGVTFAVAAGNGNFLGIPQNACNFSPARVPNAITVGATSQTDTEASFSNYGTCVDILAPGVSVTSAWYTSPTATNTISGTSMATPHVAGAAARYLQNNPGASPVTVRNALVTAATNGAIALHRRSRQNGTPNRLLFVDGGT